jgi:Asp/Glu/hydantoin racemase
MRILLINANTSDATTEKVAKEAGRIAGNDFEVKAVTAEFGPGLILTRSDNLIAAHAALSALAKHHHNCAAVVLAVSTDTGLGALREASPIPVVGMTEASLLTACLVGGRFGLIVFDTRAVPVFRELVSYYGLAQRMAAIEPVEMKVDDFAFPERVKQQTLEAVERLVHNHVVDSVVVTGATTVGLARALQSFSPVPLIDGISSAVLHATTLAKLAFPKPTVGSYASQRMRAVKGLDEALLSLIGPTSDNTEPHGIS